MKKCKFAVLMALSVFLCVLSACGSRSAGEGSSRGVDEPIEMLDGDYTYMANEILMEMLKGEWQCEEEKLILEVREDYTIELASYEDSEAVLESSISYAFLQPGDYQDVEISVDQPIMQEAGGEEMGEITAFYTEMNFTDLSKSRLVMELEDDGAGEKQIYFEKSPASDREPEAAAASNQDTVSIVDVEINSVSRHYSEDFIYVSTSWSTGTLDEQTADIYPDLQAALDNYREQLRAAMEVSQEVLTSEAREAVQNLTGEEISYIDATDEISADIMRADTRAVSILYGEYRNAGGPHPSRTFWGKNYDTVTGEPIYPEDVITDMEVFLDVVRTQLEEKYSEIAGGFYDLDAYFEELLSEPDQNLQWILGYEGITVIFNPEELGPYAIGAQVVNVYFDERPELFNTKYTAVPESYMIPVTDIMESKELYVDLDGDGERESLAVQAVVDEDSDFMETLPWYAFEITGGGSPIRLSDYGFSEKSWLIRANGQYYLYLISYSEGDLGALNVIDLTNWTYDPEKSIRSDLGDYTVEFTMLPDGETGQYDVMEWGKVDPERFALSTRMEMLGTYTGRQICHVGEDGYPVPDEEFYLADMNYAMKTLTEVDCEYVDRSGDKIGESVLEEGVYVIVMRTDNASWVDVVVIPESRIEAEGEPDYPQYYVSDPPEPDEYTDFLRIYTQESGSYYHLIDGYAEEEALAGIMYAG